MTKSRVLASKSDDNVAGPGQSIVLIRQAKVGFEYSWQSDREAKGGSSVVLRL